MSTTRVLPVSTKLRAGARHSRCVTDSEGRAGSRGPAIRFGDGRYTERFTSGAIRSLLHGDHDDAVALANVAITGCSDVPSFSETDPAGEEATRFYIHHHRLNIASRSLATVVFFCLCALGCWIALGQIVCTSGLTLVHSSSSHTVRSTGMFGYTRLVRQLLTPA